ncbi:MAG: 4a-hydroxytetrahydrobiopterin dehydratase [Flavobacteriales bacterium]|nr:4a-hydroxytetrahydrobiopterin dehydratase [Flavobacteriales bacterium]
MEPYLLNNGELKELIAKIPGWEIKSENIIREFNFTNFIDAFSFMTKVALICEKYNHHPNWENVYSKVIIKFRTHDLGGITNLDQTLAAEINNIFNY